MILNKNILTESILDDEEVQASSMKTTDLGELVGDAVGDEYSDYEFYANIVYTYNKFYKQTYWWRNEFTAHINVLDIY